MADSYKGRGVAFLVLLLFVMGPYMTLVPPAPALLLDETQKPNFVTEGTCDSRRAARSNKPVSVHA